MLTIHEYIHPADHTGPQWVELCALMREYNHELIGGPGWDVDDESQFRQAAAEVQVRRKRYLARVDGAAVGYASLRVDERDDPDAANLLVYVRPEHRGRGVGAQLAAALAEAVAADRLERLLAWITTPVATAERVSPPSGVGAVPADHPGVRLALRHGFRLAQVERVSRYDFASPLVDPGEAMREAQAAAGDDYEVLAWEGPTPDDIVDDFAVLKQRMSTDVPMGSLTGRETAWDAARVREDDARILLTNRYYQAVVRHIPTGHVVALSELVRDRTNPDAFVEQWDTIVLPSHRGHRLGMLVKAANLRQVRQLDPAASAIITWNAEENRYMLDVNEALGFREILVEAAFERAL